MTDDFEESVRLTLVAAYDNPRDAPGLAAEVVRVHRRRQSRRRVLVPLVVVLAVVLVVLPFALRGEGHPAGPAQPRPTALTPTIPAPTIPAPTSDVATPSSPRSATFAELSGWWRFTSLRAPGGTVPILKGMPAYLHFDTATTAAAEIGNNTTTFSVALAPDRIALGEGETSAVSSAAGESDVDGFLSHLTGAATAHVTEDVLLITGPDGAQAALVRTRKPANPATWTCCEPTTQAPVPVAPAGLPACLDKDLTGTYYVGAFSGEAEETPAEILVRTTGAAPCTLSGPVATTYSSVLGPVTPLHPEIQQTALTTVVLAPSLTAEQDADQAWTSALTVQVFAGSIDEAAPSGACAAERTQHITAIAITFGPSRVAVPIPGGLLTCHGEVNNVIVIR